MMWLAVFLGGGIGSLMRYGTGLVTNRFWQHAFPLATLISNLLACIILGTAVVILRNKVQHSDWWYAFIIIGICGGFSTFSSFAKENLELFEKGNYWVGVLNIVVSVGLCIMAVYVSRR
jgi:CrcB protein